MFLNFSKKGSRAVSGELADIASEVECFKDSGGIWVDRPRSGSDGVLVALDCVAIPDTYSGDVGSGD
jgi:hypothetical protein